MGRKQTQAANVCNAVNCSGTPEDGGFYAIEPLPVGS